MRARTFPVGAWLLGLILLAGGAGLAAAWPEQEKKEEPQAELAKPLVIPDEDKNRKNPVPANEESVMTGRNRWGMPSYD